MADDNDSPWKNAHRDVATAAMVEAANLLQLRAKNMDSHELAQLLEKAAVGRMLQAALLLHQADVREKEETNRRKAGGEIRASQKKAAAAHVQSLLYPRLHAADQQFSGRSGKQAGFNRLRLLVLKSIPPNDPLRKQVEEALTRARFNAWRDAGRPPA